MGEIQAQENEFCEMIGTCDHARIFKMIRKVAILMFRL
jgi:hypothetical protein